MVSSGWWALTDGERTVAVPERFRGPINSCAKDFTSGADTVAPTLRGLGTDE
jgi:hypothetical protein